MCGRADILKEILAEKPVWSQCSKEIEKAFDLLVQCYDAGGKVLVCGNGGSAADSEHIVGELMKGFRLPRRIKSFCQYHPGEAFQEEWAHVSGKLQEALPAISLSSQTALLTAIANDTGAEMMYAQLVYGYGRTGDVLIGISTSGNAKNVLYALMVGQAMGMKTIGLTGETQGRMCEFCDIAICVPESETFKIQEMHIQVYHALCAALETHYFHNT